MQNNRRKIVNILAFILSGMAFLAGCDESVSEKQLAEVVSTLRTNSQNASAGNVTRVNLNKLKTGQILVVIDSSYAGNVSAGPYITDKLANEIVLNYASKESRGAFFLLIENDDIVASQEILGSSFRTDARNMVNNAKIATPDKQVALLKCSDRGGHVDGKEAWSQSCRTIELIGFDAN